MGKKPNPREEVKEKEKKPIARVFNDASGNTLSLAESFIYLCEMYKLTTKSYNLEQSKHVTSKRYSPTRREYIKHGDITQIEKITLVAAPIKWLTDHKYIESCQDQDSPSK